jgi:hypothetical protein
LAYARDTGPIKAEQKAVVRIVELRCAGRFYREIVTTLDAEGQAGPPPGQLQPSITLLCGRHPLLGSASLGPLRTQACLARSSLTFDSRSSSEHLLGMLVVWPVCFPSCTTGRGEVCRHLSPACGR